MALEDTNYGSRKTLEDELWAKNNIYPFTI